MTVRDPLVVTVRDPFTWRVRLILRLAGLGGEMELIKGVWAFLNGKKTAIGAALQLVADVAPLILPVLPVLGVPAATVVAITAKSTIAIGLAHKLLKWLR